MKSRYISSIFSFAIFVHFNIKNIYVHVYVYISDFYRSNFVYSRISPKIQFLYYLLSSLENAFLLDFSWNFRVWWGVLKSCRERYKQLSVTRVCKKTVRDIKSLGYRVVVCLSWLLRDQDICLRYQKVRDTEYSRYRESTACLYKLHS